MKGTFLRMGWLAGLLVVLGIAAAQSAADDAVVGQNCCDDGCCRKVCVPTVETKKVSKRVYDDISEDFCLPKCSLFGHCGDGCAKCGCVRSRKYLLVKIREHEECEHKCVVGHECCPPAPCCQPAPCVPAPAMPAPAMKPASFIEYPTGAPFPRR